MKTLICEYEGKIIATGSAKVVEEFIFVDIPDKNTEVMDLLEFYRWLKGNPNWKLV
jgi:hypothetical protein